MPAKDIYHDTVKFALKKDGWTITHDTLHLTCGEKDLFVDLAAEKFVVAQKADRKIAVEIKSFIGSSPVTDLEKALGQYILYQDVLEEVESDRVLYLAIRQSTYKELFCVSIGMILLKKSRLRLIVFNPKKQEIVEWIP